MVKAEAFLRHASEAAGAVFFFRVITLARLHDTGATEITDDFLLVRSIYYGETPHVIFQHPGNGVVQGFVRVRNNEAARSNFGDGKSFVARTIESAHDVVPGNNADKLWRKRDPRWPYTANEE